MKIWIGLDWPGSGSVWTYTISKLDKLDGIVSAWHHSNGIGVF